MELACFQQTNVNLGTLLVSDNVADLLPGYEVHHSPLLSAAVLDSVHHGHLDSVVKSPGTLEHSWLCTVLHWVLVTTSRSV